MKLVLLLSALLLSTLTAEAASAVLDLTGHELQKGVEYYILPLYRGAGGGLTLASRNKTCPLKVAQESSEVVDGLPVTFSPVSPNDKTIRLSTDFNIEFSAATICVQSTVWKLGEFDESTSTWYVTTGGIKGSPGHETVSNWFKIEMYDEGHYKLVFCPQVCEFCKVICKDVGVVHENGKRWLGLSDVHFPVMFKKRIDPMRNDSS